MIDGLPPRGTSVRSRILIARKTRYARAQRADPFFCHNPGRR